MHISLARRNGKWTHAIAAASGFPMRCCQTILPVQQRPRSSAARPGETRCLAVEAAAHAVSRVIECACSRDASTAMPAPLLALVRGRPSSSAAEAVSRCGQRAAKSAAPRHGREYRFATQQSAAVDVGGHAHGVPLVSKMEPALYTVSGRQADGLRRKCNSVLIRKAKTRRAIEWQAVALRPPQGASNATGEGSHAVTS